MTVALAAGSFAGVSSPAAVAAPPSVTAPAPAAAALMSRLVAFPGGAVAALSGGAGALHPGGAVAAFPGGGQSEVKRLKAALLTGDDLPEGYRRTEKPTVFKGNLLAAKTGAPAPCDIDLDLNAALDPAKPAPAPAPGQTAMVMLQKGATDPVVLEILSIGAAGAPRAFVDAFAGQIRRCPKITLGVDGSQDKMVFTVSPLPMPLLGDASAAGTLVIKMSGLDKPVHLAMVAFAKGRATGLVAVVGMGEDMAGFPAIAQAAARRVRGLG